mmetsp:Transcript_16933/g.53550  ORF Transcript_16933/g.53550 Transcript_16933/m.53550 type:complete len:203 (-) Transcript_16933:15-623(-)
MFPFICHVVLTGVPPVRWRAVLYLLSGAYDSCVWHIHQHGDGERPKEGTHPLLLSPQCERAGERDVVLGRGQPLYARPTPRVALRPAAQPCHRGVNLPLQGGPGAEGQEDVRRVLAVDVRKLAHRARGLVRLRGVERRRRQLDWRRRQAMQRRRRRRRTRPLGRRSRVAGVRAAAIRVVVRELVHGYVGLSAALGPLRACLW